ncbi:MAG: radical SAM protein [Candidatus Omnitrophica bacterium]|nr:radical SAM protein [Candidatus Omnitrophota bacterium]
MDISSKLTAIEKALPLLREHGSRCSLCARKCLVDRSAAEGHCRAGTGPVVYTYGPHHGEEPPVSGENGSGTVFFSFCGMDCVYCQNHKFSRTGAGENASPERLAGMALELQEKGCHNINLVSPTHFLPAIVHALGIAYSKGLELPVVYNSGGYDSPEVISLLKGIVDIYLLDMRYSDDGNAVRYSSAPGYTRISRQNLIEMYSQTGQLRITDGTASGGLIIRLLVLPGDIAGCGDTLEFISAALGTEVHLSIMSQYTPLFKARDIPVLDRRITRREYDRVVDKAELLGFVNGWTQPFFGDPEKGLLGTDLALGN